MKIDIKELINYIDQGEFGLEKESLRIRADGMIAETPHPFPGDPHKDRDFCESQVELITDVGNSVEEIYEKISRLHQETTAALLELKTGPEYLWPFSNPPYLPDPEKVPIAEFTGAAREKTVYRRYLAEKYGKKRMLYSGIHMNFSFNSDFLEREAVKREYSSASVSDFKDTLYLELAEKVLSYSWLIVYLTAASPLLDGSFINREELGKTINSGYGSLRMSKYGYWNDFSPVLDFSSIEGYTDSIHSYVESGRLYASSELYYPVRIKPRGVNSPQNLRKRRANHIELRMLDLNPLSPVGICREDITFIYSLLLYLVSKEEKHLDAEAQLRALANIKFAARSEETSPIEDHNGRRRKAGKYAREILLDMVSFYQKVLELAPDKPETEEILRVLQLQLLKTENPEERYVNRILKYYGDAYVEKGVALARERALEV